MGNWNEIQHYVPHFPQHTVLAEKIWLTDLEIWKHKGIRNDTKLDCSVSQTVKVEAIDDPTSQTCAKRSDVMHCPFRFNDQLLYAAQHNHADARL